MAVTIAVIGNFAHSRLFSINMTADGDADLSLPEKNIAGITLQSDGADGAGTLTWLVSNDGTNFVAVGVNTSADPVSQTAITSATGAGAWVFPVSTLGWTKLRFHLTGSTNPNLVLTIRITYR